jgi:glycosyltransferase involved in cell wall biosynthesis
MRLSKITILMPCFNEKKLIRKSVKSLLFNGYPIPLLKIFIFDGNSTDGTTKILLDLKKKYPKTVYLFSNPTKNKSFALNQGIKKARTEIIMRADAHCIYQKNYIYQLFTSLINTKADNVGGIRINSLSKKNYIPKLLLCNLSSKLIAGNISQYKESYKKNQHVKTKINFLFFCKKKLFKEVGLFDVRLVRGQDRDFNLRLIKKNKVNLINTNARAKYFLRDNFKDFFLWIFIAGFVPFNMVSKVNYYPLFLRNFLPISFFSFLTVLFFFKIYLFIYIFFIYLFFLFIYNLINFKIKYIFPLTLINFVSHFSYSLGSLIGICSIFFKNNKC